MESGLPRLECEAHGRIASIIRAIGWKWVICDEDFEFSAKIYLLQTYISRAYVKSDGLLGPRIMQLLEFLSSRDGGGRQNEFASIGS